MSARKIIARDPKTKRQYKKWTYITEDKYWKHSGEVITRWKRWYDIEVYKMNTSEEWEHISTYPSEGKTKSW